MNRPDVLGVLTALFLLGAISRLGGPLEMARSLGPAPADRTPYLELTIQPPTVVAVEADEPDGQGVAGPPAPPSSAEAVPDGEAERMRQSRLKSMAASMPPRKAARLLEALQPEDAAAILSELPPTTAGMILAEASDEGAAKLATALAQK